MKDMVNDSWTLVVQILVVKYQFVSFLHFVKYASIIISLILDIIVDHQNAHMIVWVSNYIKLLLVNRPWEFPKKITYCAYNVINYVMYIVSWVSSINFNLCAHYMALRNILTSCFTISLAMIQPRVESGSGDPDNLGYLWHFFGGSSGSHL